jgi:uncharacterized cupin superfamily protein
VRDTAVPEATTEETPTGRVITSAGWFVMNLDETQAWTNPNSGTSISFESREHPWSGTGINVHILQPGQPACRYHQEAAQEDFLVLSGECIVIVEEQERHLRQWDHVHCPPGTRHVFVGAGDGPCAILMIGDRTDPEDLHYPVSEAAARHGEASVSQATDLPKEAYAEWPGKWEPTRATWPPA